MKKLIILVEDDKLILITLVSILKALGFDLRVCSTNAALREEFSRGIPEDAIFILDGNLGNETTADLFPLFSDHMKERTIVHSADASFRELARLEGFKQFAEKNRLAEITNQTERLRNAA